MTIPAPLSLHSSLPAGYCDRTPSPGVRRGSTRQLCIPSCLSVPCTRSLCRQNAMTSSFRNLEVSSLVWHKDIQMWRDELTVTSRVTGSCIHCPGDQNALKTNCGLEQINLQLVPSNSKVSTLLSWSHLQY